MVDYRFTNCKETTKRLPLRRVYRQFFQHPDAERSNCTTQLFEYVDHSVASKNKTIMRLMKTRTLREDSDVSKVSKKTIDRLLKSDKIMKSWGLYLESDPMAKSLVRARYRKNIVQIWGTYLQAEAIQLVSELHERR